MSKTINLIGIRVALAASEKNLLINGVPELGRVIVPRGLGLKEGTVLIGEGVFEEKTYDMGSDGVTKLAVPIVRWEMISFLSLKDKTDYNRMVNAAAKEDALSKLEIATIPSLVLDASYFAKAFGATAAMAVA